MTEKRVPQRKCVGCGQMKDKLSLLRIVASGNGDIIIDRSGKQPGRGAYICKDEKCVALAKKARRFDKAFSVRVAPEFYDTLAGLLTE